MKAWQSKWILGICRAIIQKEQLCIPKKANRFFNNDVLEFTSKVDKAVTNVLSCIKWQDVYEHYKILEASSGCIFPTLNAANIQWTIEILMEKAMFLEILSFQRSSFIFKYELFGITHEDMDDLWDIHRPRLILALYPTPDDFPEDTGSEGEEERVEILTKKKQDGYQSITLVQDLDPQ